MMLRKACFFSMTCLTLLTGCLFDGKEVAGNGSEVENGISGVVYRPDASTVAGAVVTLFPAAYNPFADSGTVLLRDTTDVNGGYAFPSPPSGSYNIEARSSAFKMSAIASSLHPDTLILSESGSITLDNTGGNSSDVYIPGTGIRTVSGSGSPVLESVPAGIFNVLFHSTGDTLAGRVPVGANHNTGLPSHIVKADGDTYLESTEPGENSGAKQFLRLKSGDQGIVLLHFNLDSLAAPDSATLWLTVSEFQMDFVDYSYEASLYGFTAPWVEGTGYNQEDPDDGSTYMESEPGVPWPDGVPGASLDSSSRIDVSFAGVRGEQIKHPFPVSGTILQGLKEGTYTAIAIVENSTGYNNSDFSSTEGYFPPELYVYQRK